MKYAVFTTNDDDTPVADERLSPVLSDAESAEGWWKVHVVTKDGELKPDFKDKNPKVHPCSDDGLPMERADTADAEAAAKDVEKLMAESTDAGAALATMIEARRLYVFALTELQRAISQRDDELHPDAVEMVIQTAAYEGSQEFDSRHMMARLQQAVLPWAQKKSDAAHHEEEEKRKRVMEENEEKRREGRVPIALSTEKGGDKGMGREKPIILAGDPAGIDILLDDAQNAAMTSRIEEPPFQFTVVRLSRKGPTEVTHDPHLRLVTLSHDQWIDCTKTAKSFPMMMQQHVYDRLQFMPDLLIVDDLVATQHNHGSADAGKEGSKCGDAMKRVMEWCRDTGCALLAGAPGVNADGLENFRWERVRQYGTLRPVRVSRDPGDDMCRISVGRDAHFVDVHKDKINNTGPVIADI